MPPPEIITRTFLLLLLLPTPGDAEQQTYTSHRDSQGGPPKADERQGDAGERYSGRDHGNVDQSLEDQPTSDARSQERSKAIWGFQGDLEAAIGQSSEKPYHHQAANQAQFLP